MSWKDEIRTIHEKGCSDSDIEDYIMSHKNVRGKDVWNYLCELDSPIECKGCKHIQMSGMSPCNSCIRRVKLQDFYEKR